MWGMCEKSACQLCCSNGNLPDIHRDPFDRLLVAQAMSEPLRLVTSDGHLSKYTDLVTTV
jgi:PIN domain nuclease of toxin-antitoxin system